ncbi:hypothetical protein ACFL2T_05490 [Elusimicrobiota bacterium]
MPDRESRLSALLLCCLMGGCACQTPEIAAPPSAAPASAARQALSTCYNLVYGFKCVPPRGFTVTGEWSGPGRIMTLMRRSRTREEGDTLTIRAHALRSDPLKWLVKERVHGPFRRAAGVRDLRMSEASIGGRTGYEVSFERQFANGSYLQRFFAFEQDRNAFIVEHSVPASRRNKSRGALDIFVGSMSFQQ